MRLLRRSAIGAALHPALAFQNVQQANQAGAVQAHALGQFLLRHAVTPGAQVQKRRPGGVGQAAGGQLFFDKAPPLAGQGDHEKAQAVAEGASAKDMAEFLMLQLICNSN
jgi:hypothetical protein